MSKARNLSKVIVNSSGVVDKASLDTTLSITGTAANVTGTVAIANGGTGATSASAARTALGVTAIGADTNYAYRANNLSDLASASAARTNLGVTATGSDTTYAYRANNLSDLASASSARTNLGLGTAATTAATDYATAAQGTKADSALQPAAIGSTVQGYDADLQAIGALTGTSGLLKKTAANTWSLDTNTYLTSAVTSVTGTAPVVSSGGTAPAISMAAATSTVNGYMTSTYAAKLDGIAAGATANTGTVTSVSGTGTVSGLSLSGTVTSTGSLTLSGTLSVTAANFASQTANTFLAAPNGTAGAPTFRAIVAADVPTLNQNTTGTASNVTGTVAIANGGTGATTRQDAIDALAGAVTSGQYLRGNGTDVVMSAIQAADVPTLNQNTTGSAGSVANALTAGTGLTASATFNGSAAVTFNATGTTINSQTSAYTLVAADAGKTISITTGGVTCPASVLAAGNIITIYNNSGSSQTITQGASLTLQWAGQTASSTGNRTLGLYGIATILYISPTVAVISGAGLT